MLDIPVNTGYYWNIGDRKERAAPETQIDAHSTQPNANRKHRLALASFAMAENSTNTDRTMTTKNFEFICTSDSCFCRSAFDAIVTAYRSLAIDSSEVIVQSTSLYVSPRIALLAKENPDLIPNRH